MRRSTKFVSCASASVLIFCLTINQVLFVKSQQQLEDDLPPKESPEATDGGNGILWEDLTCTTPNGNVILEPSSGFVANGNLCGVLGPSGSGKSTLLSILAGRPETSLRVNGHVLYQSCDENNLNNQSSNAQQLHLTSVMPDQVAWLQQQDAFFDRLTVQETLDLAVFLEWPHLAREKRQDIAQQCLDSLGLAKVRTRTVGNSLTSNSGGATLSGGELRRLSIALEMVTNPHMFIADEPTTGIDSKMSERVMKAISTLIKARKIPCICTLHQPRSSIWHMLDSIILMAPGGRICYIGSKEDYLTYFSSLGYACPEETNPAEYLVDLVSIHTDNPQQARRDQERINQLAIAFVKHSHNQQRHHHRTTSSDDASPTRRRTVSAPLRVLRRMGALFQRSWRQTIRSIGLNSFRLVMSSGTALLLSQIFPSVAIKSKLPNNKSVSDRICVLTFGAINMFLIALVKTLGLFAKESPVIQREKNHRKDYTSLEYIVSKSLAEIPLDASFAVAFATTLKLVTGLTIEWRQLSSIFALMTVAGASLGFSLGSITNNREEAAVAVAMPVVILFMIVGVINPSGVDPTTLSSTPMVVRWIKAASPIASAIEGLVVGEFSGQKFATPPSVFDMQRYRDLPRMGGLALVKSGDETLEALGLQGIQLNDTLRQMWIQSLINIVLCWIGLHLSDMGWIKQAGAFFSKQKQRLRLAKRNGKGSPNQYPKEKGQRNSNLNRLRYNDNAHRRIPSLQNH